MSNDEQALEWGVVPAPVVTVLQRLKERAASAVEALDSGQIAGDTPRSHEKAFLSMSAATEAADRATRDYRSVFNAYVHKFHKPKPRIGALAAMQGTITQTFAKRYTAKTVDAIESLLSRTPNIETIHDGIKALRPSDLRGISPDLDEALSRAQRNRALSAWFNFVDVEYNGLEVEIKTYREPEL